MPETAELPADQGQPVEDSTGTPNTGTETSIETTAAPTQTTEKGTGEETFFDPTNIPEELKPAYKEMQRAFTKKTSAIKKNQQAIDAYNDFMRDPVGKMTHLARQYGYNLSPAQAAAAAAEPKGDWQPKTWQEVIEKAKAVAVTEAESKMVERFSPLIHEYGNIRKTQIEKTLDETVPEWRTYEDEMSELLTEHPSLVNDPEKLARLAIPDEVLKGRAMQEAMKKLQEKAEATKVSSGSKTNKNPTVNPNKSMTFQESVEFAKQQLRDQGLNVS